MPKRRLSEHQRRRILAIQERRRQRLESRTQAVLDALDTEQPEVAADVSGGARGAGAQGSSADVPQQASQQGRVVVRHGAHLGVEDEVGELHHCVARRHLGHPVCGDLVVWAPTEPGRGVVTALCPRDNVLSRPDYGGRDKPLAANLSLLAVVVAPQPPPSGFLLDQYLVAAELMGVRALVVAAKLDLLDPHDRRAFLDALAPYPALGYPVCPVSTKGEPGIGALLTHLPGETAILLGQSGVGKSSLVQQLLPDQDIQVGRLSAATGLGRHTTSTATCYRLSPDAAAGGRLIDSPGVRSFRLAGLSQAQLEDGFPELRTLRGQCRFRDCRHLDEPDCAVHTAVAAGGIHPQRLARFQQLREGLVR
ncbi:ribosome small subunit-dependent GTPase A [uncultured Thiohalocapsa sp.]|uniref:ribosome small subunit-dependent GTPase A n=1 Tax=uncultured Thiohalocapsa sp. TaxID=768990 RepID=UPI0025E71F44|nr:ribosome small subunit-dependent GTPase A [uncultured Thiohalocapsa sp.]